MRIAKLPKIVQFATFVSIVIFVDITQVLNFLCSELLFCYTILDSPIPLTKPEDRQVGE
jgi:hypothetical protein